MQTEAQPKAPNNLRALRLDRGLTQEALARQVRLSVFTVNRLESQRTRPSLTSAQKIARALKCSIDAVFPRLRP